AVGLLLLDPFAGKRALAPESGLVGLDARLRHVMLGGEGLHQRPAIRLRGADRLLYALTVRSRRRLADGEQPVVVLAHEARVLEALDLGHPVTTAALDRLLGAGLGFGLGSLLTGIARRLL